MTTPEQDALLAQLSRPGRLLSDGRKASDWRIPGQRANPEIRSRFSPGTRYYPRVIHVDPPLLPDGKVDVRTLLRGWDSDYNDRLNGPNVRADSATLLQVNSSGDGAALTARPPAAPTQEVAT